MLRQVEKQMGLVLTLVRLDLSQFKLRCTGEGAGRYRRGRGRADGQYKSSVWAQLNADK